MSNDLELKPADYFTVGVLDNFFPPEGEPPGFTPSWERTKGRMRFLPAELTIWSGTNGHGKSLILNQILLDAITKGGRASHELGEKGGIFSFEMPPKKTLYRLVRQATGKRCPEMEEVTGCLEWLSPRLFVFPKLGTWKMDRISPVLQKAVEDHGLTQIVIDSLMKMGVGVDDYNAQKAVVDELQTLAQRLNIHIHLVAHTKKQENEMVKPGKFDVKGDSGITDLASNVMVVWRNKRKENILLEYNTTQHIPRDDKGKLIDMDAIRQQSDAIINFCKSREYGSEAEGHYGFFFNGDSLQYVDRAEQEPTAYYWHDAPPF
jgi:twinkle protein